MKMAYQDPLPAATTTGTFNGWRSVVSRHECASIISLPQFDRQYRVAQFLATTQRDANTQWLSLAFQSLVTEIPQEVIKRLDLMRDYTQKQTVFIVLDAEWLLTAAPAVISAIQNYIHEKNRSISFIFFFEKNLLAPGYASLTTLNTSFLQNIIYQNMYSAGEVDHFLQHLAGIYEFEIGKTERNKIIEECGGYIWLSTEAIRHFQATKKLTFDHEAMEFRLRAVWQGLSFDEQQMLRKLVFNEPLEAGDDPALTYFQKTGLIRDSHITIPIIQKYLEIVFKTERRLTVRQNHELYLGVTPVNSMFSKREIDLLQLFLTHKHKILAREEIARALWSGEEAENYNDWTLDQVIKRLRSKLKSLHLAPDLIKTIKGKGIEFKG